MYSFKTLVTACLIFSRFSTLAQVSQQPDTLKTNSKEFAAVEIEASYPGGSEAWQKFLQKNLNSNIPPLAQASACALQQKELSN